MYSVPSVWSRRSVHAAALVMGSVSPVHVCDSTHEKPGICCNVDYQLIWVFSVPS